jgi:hypothetical protein
LFYICEKAEIRDIKLQKNRKILMTTVPPGGLFEYTRRPLFVSTSVHFSKIYHQTNFPGSTKRRYHQRGDTVVMLLLNDKAAIPEKETR